MSEKYTLQIATCDAVKKIGTAIGILLLLSLTPSRIAAQTFNASVEGTVTDESGAVIPGADLTLENTETGIRQNRKSDNRGYFLFTLVPPGTYQLNAAATGFQPFERKDMRLEVQQQASVNIRLSVGAVSSSVAVAGEAPRLDAVDATLGRVVGRETLDSLPVSDNNSLNLIFLAAGVTAPLAPGLGWTGSNFVSNGTRQAMSDVLVDGVTATVREQNGGATDVKYRPSVENIEELKVQTNSFSAEYGFTGGTVVNVVSRSGTNQLKGTLYETLQNSAMNANEFFANAAGRPLVPARQNLFGFNLGAPIRIPHLYNGHDRTFFFFSQEWTRQATQLTTLETHPTSLQLAGNFSQTLLQNGTQVPIYDPATAAQNSSGTWLRSPFPGNIIPTSRFNPVAAATIKLYPAPNTPGVAFTNANNYFNTGSETFNANQTSFKVDHNFNDRQRLSGRFSRAQAATQAPHFWGGTEAESTGGWGWHYTTDNAFLDYTNTLSPSTVLDLRWGLTRYQQHSTPSCGFCPYDPSALGFAGSVDAQLPPQLAPAGYTTLFPAASQQIIQANDVNHLVANLSKVAGRHTMKVGAEARLFRLNYGQPGVNSASFAFSRQGTGQNPLIASNTQGDGFASFLLGWGTGSESTDLRSAWAFKSYGFFFQDDIHVTSTLTLNVGLRYELPTPATERYNRISWFDQTAASPLPNVPGLPNLMGGLVFGNSSNRTEFDTPKKNFGPRIGLAWQFRPGTVMRAGYGIFDGLSPAQDRSPLGTGFKTSTTWNQSLDGGITQFNPLNNPFPSGVNTPPGSSLGLATNLGLALGSTPIRYWDTTPYFQQWSFSLQHQLPMNSVVEAVYSGSRGVHLVYSADANIDHIDQSYYSLGTGLNTLVPNPFYGIITNPSSALSQPMVQRIALLRPYPQFASVSGAPGPPIGNSTYHSAQVKFTKRLSSGLNFNFRYTFAKMIDDTSVNGAVSYLGGGSTVQTYSNLRLEKAVSLLDITHFAGIDFTYQLPVGRGKYFGNNWNRAEDMIMGGWQVGGNMTFHTGIPLVPTLASGNLPDANQLPNLLFEPGINGSPESKLNQYLNPAAFSIPAPYTFGNAPRTLSRVRAPGLADADMSLFKSVYFTAEHRRDVQIRFEVFNVTNTPFFSSPNMSVGSSSFGVISSTQSSAQGTPGFFGAGPRLVQVGLKVNF